MKYHTFTLLFFSIFLSACVRADQNGHAEFISVSIKNDQEGVLLKISNTSDDFVNLYNATIFSASQNDPGVAFDIRDDRGKSFEQCAMINPAYEAGEFVVSNVSSKHPTLKNFDISSLARVYCLTSGIYSIRAILKQPTRTYRSNEIRITVPRDFNRCDPSRDACIRVP
jgi:hypothetical protein